MHLGSKTSHRDRLFSGQIASRLDRINACIKKRAATGHLRVEQPLLDLVFVRAHQGTGIAPGELVVAAGDVADDTLGHQLNRFDMMRLPVETVIHSEQNARFLCRSDHRFTFLTGDRHGLFHHDVFAGPGALDRKLGVHGIRQCDVDHIDSVVGSDFIDGVVGIDCVRGEAILRGPLFALRVRVAGHDAGQGDVFTRSDLRSNITGGMPPP